MTGGFGGFGSLLKIGDGGGGGEVFTTIAEVTDIGGPKLKLNPIEMTSHDSTAGWKEFIGGLLEAGEMSFDLNFMPVNATHSYTSGLINDMVNRTLRNFQLVFPDTGTTTWAFSALVTSFETKEPIDDKLGASVTLQISGQPTLAG